jgi:hypothetical protein
MMAICGARGRIKDKAYLHHIYCKIENWIQGKNNSYNPIKMCTCLDDGFGQVDTRPIMGARYYHIYDESCGDGKVDTRPRTGTSCYHQFYVVRGLVDGNSKCDE